MGFEHLVQFTPDVAVPMRDGVVLRADIYRPEVAGPRPAVLARTPYNKQLADPARPWLRYAAAGYVVVVQDCRGCFASEGTFTPFADEMQDGFDSVEWVAAQPWSTGKVGMYGTSYLGVTQWMAAMAAPPHLTTIVPSFTASDYHEGWIYQSGALLHSFALGWALPFAMRELSFGELTAEQRREATERILAAMDDIRSSLRHRPMVDTVLDQLGVGAYYREWLEHPDAGPYWDRWSVELHHHRITVPVLAFGGWYDMFLGGTLRNFIGMRRSGGSEVARANQRLVIGGWQHGKPLFGPNPDPDFDFGVRAGGLAFDVDGLALRWFDHWLKGEANGVGEEPPLTLFTLGANSWRTAGDWPLPGTEKVDYFLHSEGAANTLASDGRLDRVEPADEPPDVYVFDPRQPVPTHGGGTFGGGGARDQRQVESNPGVLVYTSAPLTADIEVTGPLEVRLHASTTGRDTDFTAKLVDVHPDGRAMNVADNVIRARYRHDPRRPEPVEPGAVEEYTIDLYGVSIVFRRDHRIRVEISSSSFPRFDPNPNTGTDIATETCLQPVLQTVHHSASHPSRIVLPVVPT
jgi:putative CocE/NonD family hydrolase